MFLEAVKLLSEMSLPIKTPTKVTFSSHFPKHWVMSTPLMFANQVGEKCFLDLVYTFIIPISSEA